MQLCISKDTAEQQNSLVLKPQVKQVVERESHSTEVEDECMEELKAVDLRLSEGEER